MVTFLACWITHAELGLSVTPGDEHPPGAELDEEQHVRRLQPDRFYRE
jgi:hypothetical protein